MSILLITGESGSGKSTLAKNIASQLNKNITTFAFGDVLKQFTADLFDIPLENFYNEKKEEHRHFLKNTSDLVKKWYPLFFTSRTIYETFGPKLSDLYVCQDWRFDYELSYLRERFPSARIRTIRLLKGFKNKGDHNSERTLDKHIVDLTIDNTNLKEEKTLSEVMKRIQIWFPELFN